MLSKNALCAAVAVVACAFTFNLASHAEVSAGSKSARPLITQKIDETKLVTLEGNTRPEARNPEYDRGAVAAGFAMNNILLQLKRSPEQEQALVKLIDQMHTPGNPNFHQWLNEPEFDEAFGVNREDVQKVTSWLESQGFKVNGVEPDGLLIDFSGTAAMVESAFHTDIHKLVVDGKDHYANISDPRIPVALANVVVGPAQLTDFKAHKMSKRKVTSRNGSAPQLKKGPNGEYTFSGCNYITGNKPGGGGDTNCYAMVPGDMQTIYNLTPFYDAGYTGKGTTIALIEEGDDYSDQDWTTFMSTFGLTHYGGTLTTIHPTGAASCSDPGQDGVDDEVELDVEWSSSAAPGAAVEIVSCPSLLSAVNNLVAGATPPPVMSMSYGECEAKNGATNNASYATAFQKAVAKGISVFVSSGDESATSCDADADFAVHGIGVSGFTSTPYNVSVGGTDFGDVAAGTASAYWSTTNGTYFNSAKSYVPEIPWNDSCASELISTYLGYPTTYGASGFCNSSLSTTNDNFLDTGSGSGGPSGCYTGASATNEYGTATGTCAGQPKPTWQTVFGNPADGVRDIPNVSLMAANGIWNHYYVACWSDTAEGGAACTAGNPSVWAGFGGTSISSPIMAGIQALINQYVGGTTNGVGTAQGNPNYVYYNLAAAEYGAAGSAGCNSSASGGPSPACIFYDVTQGDMNVNCQTANVTGRHVTMGTFNCYLDGETQGVGSLSNSSYEKMYGTTTGWDFATGIGSVNAWNLATAWNTTFPTLGSITFTSTSHNFGQVQTGTAAATYGIAVKNTSTTTAFPFSVVFTSDSTASTASEGFSYVTNCGASIAAGKSCELEFNFTPKAAGPVSAFWTLARTNGFAYSPGNGGNLTGSGTAQGGVSLTTNGHNFGTVAVGTTSATYGTELSNSTSSAETLSLGTPSAPFHMVTNCGTTLAAGSSCEIEFTYKPTTTSPVSQVVPLSGTPTAITSGGAALPNGGITLSGN